MLSSYEEKNVKMKVNKKTLKSKKNDNKKRKVRKTKKKSSLKMIGGNPSSNFYCNLTQTEANHDLSKVLSHRTISSPKFINIVNQKSGANCSDSNFNVNDSSFFNDPQLVYHITNNNPSDLKDDKSIYVLTKRSQPDRIVCTLKFQAKKNNSAYDNDLYLLFENQYSLNNHIVEPSNQIIYVDLFFIIDTGDNLIMALKKFNPPIAYMNIHFRLHIIHNVFTLGDSARKGLPENKKFECNRNRVHIYSWLHGRYPIVNPNDNLFMTHYEIRSKILPNYKVQQNWYYNDQNIYQTYDSKKDNNNSSVKNEISRTLSQPRIYGDQFDDKINLAIQKKRSGDYFQIWFARRFPRFAANDNMNFAICYQTRGKPTINFPYPPQGENPTTWFRERTFFVTGDWPAFSYSLYNRINSIMFSRKPSGFISASFI